MKLIYFALIIFLILFPFALKKEIENYTVDYKLKKFNIPNLIYRTHKTKNVCLPMYKYCHEKWIKLNPDYSMIWFDNKECEKYLENLKYSKNTFLSLNANRILECYNKIKPGAYKADLWRLIILYDKGGVYVDSYASPFVSIDEMLNSINSIDDISLITVRDCICKGIDHGIHNGFMISTPENLYIKNCISEILSNIESNYYGFNPLSITGPICMYDSFLETIREKDGEINKLKIGCNKDLYLFEFEWGPYQNIKNIRGEKILCKKYSILHQLYVASGGKGYSQMWRKGKVY